MAAAPAGPPAAQPDAALSPERRARPPWRELGLAASLLVFGWPVLLLAFAFPFAAFSAWFGRGAPRLASGLCAAAIPLLLALQVPEGRFFVAAAVLAVAATLAAVARRERLGYGDLALWVSVGMAAAALVWLAADPAFFDRLRAWLEATTLRESRLWMGWVAGQGRLDDDARALLEDAARTSARWSARSWPAVTFLALWMGIGPALGLAARWAPSRRGEDAPPAHASESFAEFRLPEVWVWVFVAGIAGFLLLPGKTGGHDAALNAALVAAGLYACQGLALGLYYLERRGIGPLRRAIAGGAVLLLFPLPLLIAALCLGLADVWLDLRARAAGAPPPPGGI